MDLITRVLAGMVLAVCLALLVRMVIGARLRSRLDAAAQRLWQRVRRGRPLPTRTERRADPKEAARMAQEAIRRASRRGRWEGNVYKPDAFRPPTDDKPTDRRKPH